MSKLFLDALYPPAPAQLVADLRSVGAAGCFVYVSRPGGIGNWTPAHVAELVNAGLLVVPIIVPPPAGAPPAELLAEAHAFGFGSGPITLDLEPPNVPPAAWEEEFDAAAAAAGFRDFDYGTQSTLGQYAPDQADWFASWIRTGQLEPLPTLPAGWAAWQFVNSVQINGSTYDASVVADSVFGGPPVVIEDTVTPSSPVPGRVWPPNGAAWLNWSDLASVGSFAPTGTAVTWTEAKKVAGIWYDRIEAPDGSPGAWCLNDADVDDGGHDPTFFRPPLPPPAPAPAPSPLPDPLEDRVHALEQTVDVLAHWHERMKAAQ